MFIRLFWPRVIAFIVFSFLFSACDLNPSTSNDRVKVVVTTTLVGDAAARVGGDRIDLSVMIPVGADLHSFVPTPGDIAKVTDANLVLVNGVELESFLDKLIENAGDEEAKVVSVSDGIELLALEETTDEHADGEHTDEDDTHDEHAEEGEDTLGEHAHEHGEFDPHVWQDPNNVIIWVNNIAAALSERDPENAASYRANAETYIAELQALDIWIQEQLEQVPTTNRRFITEHGAMNYFAARYGFEVVSTVIPGFSTLSQPSAQELAELENAIHDLDVKVILVGNTVSPTLADQIAQDTGILLVPIFTDSLSEPDGEAPTYLDFMRYNVQAIINGLK